MLDINALNALEEMTAYTLYDAEVARLARLSREESRALVERARQGDEEARHELILNCLHFALVKARAIYRTRQPAHIDMLDLVGVANLEMVERFDKALTASDPVSYLMTLAIREMQLYCTYHAPLIQRPEYSLKKLARVDPHPATVESLDEPVYRDGGQRIRVEVIEAPARSQETDEQQEQHRFTPLYEAVKRLSRKQRATIIRLFGLFGQPAETLDEIAQESHLQYDSVCDTAYLARKRLRILLAEDLAQMLTPKPKRDEE